MIGSCTDGNSKYKMEETTMKNTIKPAYLRIGNIIILCGVRNDRKPTVRTRAVNVRRLSEAETPKVGAIKHFGRVKA